MISTIRSITGRLTCLCVLMLVMAVRLCLDSQRRSSICLS